MRWISRSPRFVSAFAVVSVLAWTGLAPVAAETELTPSPAVTMFDNDASGMVFHPLQPYWGYGPDNIAVMQGEVVTFYNPSSNAHPHTVTNLERVGPPFPTSNFRAGTRFDSSPTQQTLMMPGDAFTLDTASLSPGNYPYLCKLHPWMQGVLTVLDPAAQVVPARRSGR
jgi:plastocyanin